MTTKTEYRVATPISAPGAVAIIELLGDVDAGLSALGIRGVEVGRTGLRDLAGVDRGVVARWSVSCAHLMPHGGPAVLRALLDRVHEAGIARSDRPDPRVVYPEALDEIEARMLDALARAASPLAVDLLLAQPERWRSGSRERTPTARDLVLRRLIAPPLVVLRGPANVGKSTLTNTLAGEHVSIVADEPGTTRDHVGVTLDLGGLVVRWTDSPGVRADAGPEEAVAAAIADELTRRADLVVLCGDASSPPPPIGEGRPDSQTLRVALRSDLGRATWAHDYAMSVRSGGGGGGGGGGGDGGDGGGGVDGFVAAVRDRLLPPAMLRDPEPWMFWSDEHEAVGSKSEGRTWGRVE